MKKLYFLLFTILMTTVSFGQDLVLTAVYDGPLTGGTPKGVELFVINDIADLSAYGLGSANNGGGTDGEEFTFPAGTATAGSYIYVASEAPNFTAFFGFAPDHITGVMGINGDDAIELFQNGAVIDTFGDINVDGNGTPWEYLDGWAYRVDGTGPDGGFVLANWAFSGANAYDGETTNATAASPMAIGTYSQMGSTNPTVTITSPANNAVFNPGTTMVNVEFSTANLTGGETVDITVNGTTTTNVTSPFAVTTMDGTTYNVTAELVNGGILDSDMRSFSVNSSTQVADIAALRAGTIGQIYELTGEALLTYQQGFRNQKFIEDATGGILIDDTAGNITTTYAIGDGISGIVGTLGAFGGMMQFAPTQDSGMASSLGNTLTPQIITVAVLAANPENYESELVQVTAVTMDATTPNFTGGSEHAFTQGADTFNFRSTFFSADYVTLGGEVPTVPTDIIGVVNERNGSLYFLTARDTNDFSATITLSTNDFELTNFSIYPNPTNTGFVNITTTSNEAVSVSVFNILGKQVISQELANEKLNVSNLNSGVYLVRLTQNGNSTTKKLVIE